MNKRQAIINFCNQNDIRFSNQPDFIFIAIPDSDPDFDSIIAGIRKIPGVRINITSIQGVSAIHIR